MDRLVRYYLNKKPLTNKQVLSKLLLKTKRKGLTIKDVCKLSGLSESGLRRIIWKIEDGKEISPNSYHTIYAAYRWLGCYKLNSNRGLTMWKREQLQRIICRDYGTLQAFCAAQNISAEIFVKFLSSSALNDHSNNEKIFAILDKLDLISRVK